MSFQRVISSKLGLSSSLNRASRLLKMTNLQGPSFSALVLDQWLHGEPEFRVIARFCDRSKMTIDVGVAAGYYLHIFARHSGHCVGFEPNPGFFAGLRSRFPKVRLESCALSAAPGQFQLRVPRVKGALYGGFGTIEPANTLSEFSTDALVQFPVEVRTLDSFDFDNVGLIKIDVEGHEWDVVQGAAATIAKSRPNLMIEIEERHKPGNLAKISEFFRQQGYAAFFLKGGRLRPLAAFDVGTLQDAHGPIRPGTYFNNFFFLASPQAYPDLLG